MNKIIIILLFLSTYLFASSQEISIMAKAEQKENLVKAKILVRGDFLNPNRAKMKTGDEKNAYFIKHVTAQVNGDTVYNISMNYTFMHGRVFVLLFDFIYKGRGDTLHVTVTDNKGKKSILKIKIKNSLGEDSLLNSKKSICKSINLWEKKAKLFELTDTKDAIKELYKIENTKFNTRNIFDVEELRSTSYYYSLMNIKTKIPVQSVSIFSDDFTSIPYRKDRDKVASIRAVFSIPEGTTINYKSAYILTIATCCDISNVPITIVGMDREGKLYKTVVDARLNCSEDCAM